MANEKMVDVIEVSFRGKTYTVLPKDFDTLKKELIKPLSSYVKSLSSSMKANMKIYEEYLETGTLKNGILKAVSLAVVLRVGNVKMPDVTLATKAMSALGALERAISSESLIGVDATLPTAETAINAFSNEMMRFVTELGGKAYKIGTTLQVATAAGFLVVGAMGASVLVVGGMSAAAAATASSAAVAVLQASTKEVARAALGEKVDFWESVKTVVLDGTVAALSAGVASKLPLKFIDDLAGKLAPQIAAKLTGGAHTMTGKELLPYLTRFLSGSGSSAATTAVTEAIKTLGEAVKKGEKPTEKQFFEICQKVFLAALTGGFIKNLNTFHTKWVYDSKALIETKLVAGALKKLLGSNLPPRNVQVKILADVVKAVSDDVIAKGVEAVADQATGSEDGTKLAAIATSTVEKDSKIKAQVEKEVEKSLKKNKIEVK